MVGQRCVCSPRADPDTSLERQHLFKWFKGSNSPRGPSADGHLPGGLLSLVKIHRASTWDAELTVSGGWP